MFRTLGAVALLLIVTSTSGQAQQGRFTVAVPAKPVVVAAPVAQDLSGSWVGMIVIPEKDKRTPTSLYVVLKHDGAGLTGTAGSNSKAQAALADGRVESTRFGTTLSFDLPAPHAVLEFQLRLDAGMLKGVARLPGVTATAAVELHRIDSTARTNLNGTWIGTFSLATAEHLLHVVLEQSGDTLTGTAGPHPYKQIPITKCKIATTDAGTTVSFQMDMAAEDLVMQFDLASTDTGLKGTVTVSHKGEQVTGPVELVPVR